MTPLGLDVHEPLTLAEWCDIGRRIGRAMRSIAFVVGDWLVYGEGRDGQMTLFWPDIPEHDQRAASRSTPRRRGSPAWI